MTKTIGEHWVCATLARYGWAPALTRDGLERTDILAVATHIADRPTIEVQVKTTTTDAGNRTSWYLGKTASLTAASEHEWVVLVLAPKPLQPLKAFVVPLLHTSAATWIVYQSWLTNPSVPAGKRNTPLRQAKIEQGIFEQYEDCWGLLGTPTTDVEVRLPGWLREAAQEMRIGLPPGHPWNNELPQW